MGQLQAANLPMTGSDQPALISLISFVNCLTNQLFMRNLEAGDAAIDRLHGLAWHPIVVEIMHAKNLAGAIFRIDPVSVDLYQP